MSRCPGISPKVINGKQCPEVINGVGFARRAESASVKSVYTDHVSIADIFLYLRKRKRYHTLL